MTTIVILLVTLAIGILIGMLFRRRDGKVRRVTPAMVAAADKPRRVSAAAGSSADTLLRAAGVGALPTVLHFSADWCGPCAAVRRVVGQVVRDLEPDHGNVLEIELDLDENPVLAKELGVMSLPTTFIYDAAGTQRYRIAGVPKAAALQDALESVV